MNAGFDIYLYYFTLSCTAFILIVWVNENKIWYIDETSVDTKYHFIANLHRNDNKISATVKFYGKNFIVF